MCDVKKIGVRFVCVVKQIVSLFFYAGDALIFAFKLMFIR